MKENENGVETCESGQEGETAAGAAVRGGGCHSCLPDV